MAEHLFIVHWLLAVVILKLPFTYHLHTFNAGQYRRRSTKWFESQHQSYSSFNITVNLFYQIIQIVFLPDGDTAGSQELESTQGATLMVRGAKGIIGEIFRGVYWRAAVDLPIWSYYQKRTPFGTSNFAGWIIQCQMVFTGIWRWLLQRHWGDVISCGKETLSEGN